MLARHDAVSTAVGLPGDNRDLGYRRLGESVKQLGAMFDDAAIFLRRARHESGNVNEGEQGNIEGIIKHGAKLLYAFAEATVANLLLDL